MFFFFFLDFLGKKIYLDKFILDKIKLVDEKEIISL